MRVEALDLCYQYDMTAPEIAVSGVSLTIDTGRKMAVVGPSGSGKSTLLLLLAGLLRAQSGTVRYDGREVHTKAGQRWLRGQVGVALQQPEQQLFAATVWDEVMFGPINIGRNHTEAREMASYALALVSLDPAEVGDRSPFSLGGGERRRVALASALALQPRFLVLDEPTAGLHPGAAAELTLQLDRAVALLRATCIIATHNLQLACRWADELAVMAQGKLLAVGAPASLLGVVEEAGLAPPDLLRLTLILRRKGWNLPLSVGHDAGELAAAICAVLEERL